MLVAIEISGASDDSRSASRMDFGEPAGRRGSGGARHQNGELVAAEARHHLTVVEQRADARSDDLQGAVTRGVPEQIVDFLEAVEIETENPEALAGLERRDFLIDAGVEEAAVRQSRQRVMMREEMDVLLGILARLQVAHRDDVMGPLGKDDRPHDQFDRRHRTVAVAQFGFDSVVGLRHQLEAGDGIRETVFQRAADETVGRDAHELRKTFIGRDDRLSVTDQKSFDGSIGELPHPVGLELRAALIANVHHDGRRRHSENRRGWRWPRRTRATRPAMPLATR